MTSFADEDENRITEVESKLSNLSVDNGKNNDESRSSSLAAAAATTVQQPPKQTCSTIERPITSSTALASTADFEKFAGVRFIDYIDESQLEYVMSLVGRDLSEPYSIFTYRYFLVSFPNLCIIAVPDDDDNDNQEEESNDPPDHRQHHPDPIGCVVAKIDKEELLVQGKTEVVSTGYIGMLAVKKDYRRKGIGKALVQKVIQRMKDMGCSSVTLETEVTNVTAQRLYQDIFGFVREELLVRYYLNWNDAYRLRLWFKCDDMK